MKKSEQTGRAVEKLYEDLLAAGTDVSINDRDVRVGVMFADIDRIGIPQRVVIGELGLANGYVVARPTQHMTC